MSDASTALNEALETRDIAVAQLEEQAVRQQLKAIEQFGSLVESDWQHLGEPNVYSQDEHPYGEYNTAASTMTAIDDRTGERWLPLYRNEHDLRTFRQQARIIDAFSSVAIGATESLVNYTLGTGFTATVKAKKENDEAVAKIAAEAQSVLDVILESNRFGDGLEFDIAEEAVCDGDLFVSIDSDGGEIIIDIENTDAVTEPDNPAALERWIYKSGQLPRQFEAVPNDWTYGIHTRNRKRGRGFIQDFTRPLGYHFVYTNTGDEWDWKPSSRVVHFKRNVPRRAPRGVSDFVPVLHDLQREPKLRNNIAAGAAARAAIVFIRKHVPGADQGGVSSMIAGSRTRQVNRQVVGGTAKQNVERWDRPQIKDIPDGMDYAAGPSGDAREAQYVEVRQMLLRAIGQRWTMPEYMISGDASNANFASTLVAESPFVKARERDQRYYVAMYRELFWKVLRLAFDAGRFGRGMNWQDVQRLITIDIETSGVASRDLAQQAATDQLLQGIGVKSRRSIATGHGLDLDEEKSSMKTDGDPDPNAPPEMGQPPGPGQENVVEHDPGGKPHDQSGHGNWSNGGGKKRTTRDQDVALEKFRGENSKLFVIDSGSATGTAIVKAGSLTAVVRPDGSSQELPQKFVANFDAMIKQGIATPADFPAKHKSEPESVERHVKVAGLGVFQVRATGDRKEYYDQQADKWKRLTGHGTFQKALSRNFNDLEQHQKEKLPEVEAASIIDGVFRESSVPSGSSGGATLNWFRSYP